VKGRELQCVWTEWRVRPVVLVQYSISKCMQRISIFLEEQQQQIIIISQYWR